MADKRKIVAYCGGKMSCDNTNPYITPKKSNIQNILDNWSSATGTSANRPKNETDADAFVFEKDEDTGDVQLHIFRTCCSPKMTCTYSGAGKIISNNTNIWQKILNKGTSNEVRVMADYNDFADQTSNNTIRIGSYGSGEDYEGFAQPSTVEYSFINVGNDIPEETNEGMFEDVDTLTTCNIPCQMRKIAKDTFKGCTSLTSYTEPDWIDTIGISAFEGCTSMTNIVIGKYAKLSSKSFAECNGATTIEWKNTKETDKKCRMTFIPSSAFINCTNLRYTKFSGNSSAQDAIIIPSGITKIYSYAFQNCVNIRNLKMYDVTEIEAHAFEGCIELHGVTGMSKVTSVGDSAFNLYGNTWTTNTMGNLSQMTTIGQSAFANVIFNGDIRLDNCSSLGDRAFENATLDSVTIPSNVGSVPSYCFDYAKINGSLNVTASSINERAFYGTSINGNSYISLNNNIEDEAFYGALINGSLNITADTIENSAFYQADFGSGYGDLDLTNINTIEGAAFCYSDVTSITLNSGISLNPENGSWGCFEQCTSLTSVTFNGSAYIGQYCFNACSNLNEVTINGSISGYDSSCFANTNITKLTLGSSVMDLSDANNCFRAANISNVYINYYSNVVQNLNSAFDTSKSITFKLANSNLISQYQTTYSSSSWTFVSQ